MSKYNKEELEKQFATAPDMIRQALFSDETSAAVRAIGDKHGLHIDQIGSLADEIGVTMLGLEPASDFIKNIQTRLNISASEAEQIAMEVNKNIFLRLREVMKKPEEIPETPTPTNLDAAPSLLERKLSEPVSQQASERVVESNAKPIQHVDPYLEPIE